MTHLERLFAALYVSEGWYSPWKLNPERIAWKARAVVVFDRVFAGEMKCK
jgi:hypothetical protein